MEDMTMEMNMEDLNNFEETNEIEETSNDEVFDGSGYTNDKLDLATTLKVVGAITIVSVLTFKGAKDITTEYVIPGAKKVGSAVMDWMPFGKGKGKNKKSDIDVVADVEYEEVDEDFSEDR